MQIAQKITDLIGKTPLLDLTGLMEKPPQNARLLAKLEFMNPCGSVKDRIGLSMIEDAEKRGVIGPGATILEATSGNTGIGLAMTVASRGYRMIAVMPESMSIERRKLLKALGAKIELTPAAKGMNGAIERVRELERTLPGAYWVRQFENTANPDTHYRTTGPEIWQDTDGTVDFLVAGVGTGGTLSGAGRYLKQMNKGIRIAAVEPDNSAVLSGKQKGPHGIQGIGAGFIPDTMDVSIVDRIILVKDEDALRTSRSAARQAGVLCGISAGAALWAAMELIKTEQMDGKTVVAIIPDTGERYLSTALFESGEDA